MRIVAIFAVYNEERFMERAIRHLVEQGVESYVIDNASTDRTAEIARSFLGRGVIGMESFPRHGVFEWAPLLKRKEELHREIAADWYLHQDADQFRYAPNPHATLYDGIAAVDRAGFSAINFDVFDFLPTEEGESYDHPRFFEEMQYYYYFRHPRSLFHVNAWRNFGQTVDLVSSGGHSAEFAERRVSPVPFIQRHYMALSKQHAIEKYCQKRFSEEEVTKRGWHHPRPGLRPEDLHFPARCRLKKVSEGNTWDTTDPWPHRALFGRA